MALVAAAAREAYDGPLLTGAIEVTATFDRVRRKGDYGTGRNAIVADSCDVCLLALLAGT